MAQSKLLKPDIAADTAAGATAANTAAAASAVGWSSTQFDDEVDVNSHKNGISSSISSRSRSRRSSSNSNSSSSSSDDGGGNDDGDDPKTLSSTALPLPALNLSPFELDVAKRYFRHFRGEQLLFVERRNHEVGNRKAATRQVLQELKQRGRKHPMTDKVGILRGSAFKA
jgi:hypothetical protein